MVRKRNLWIRAVLVSRVFREEGLDRCRRLRLHPDAGRGKTSASIRLRIRVKTIHAAEKEIPSSCSNPKINPMQ